MMIRYGVLTLLFFCLGTSAVTQGRTARIGDDIDRRVNWPGDRDLEELAGESVRLRFYVKDGDVHSFRFTGSDGER